MNLNLSKYQRQISLKSFGLDKQSKLSQSHVLIIGLGGLGVPVAQYLNAMGVGTLGIMDQDTIALNNLHRQVLYTEDEVGQTKTEIAAKKLQKQNTQTKIIAIPEFLNKENALESINRYDVVVDASDNFATRYLVNDACVILNKPFVYGALHDFEGQVSVFNYNDGPTYRCLFPSMPKNDEIPNCDENGVLGVLPGILGSIQALEVVKILTGIGEVLSGRLLLINALTHENRLVHFKSQSGNKNIKALADSYENEVCSSDDRIDVGSYLERKGKKQLIDVRSIEEFNADHLDEAVSIPLQDLQKRMDEINLERPVYLICQSGRRSAQAAQLLSELHPKTRFYSIDGGMNQIASLCQ